MGRSQKKLYYSPTDSIMKIIYSANLHRAVSWVWDNPQEWHSVYQWSENKLKHLKPSKHNRENNPWC